MKHFPVTRIETQADGTVLLHGVRGTLQIRRGNHGTNSQFTYAQNAWRGDHEAQVAELTNVGKARGLAMVF